MDSPKSNKTHYIRCLKCKKILNCSRYDTNALLKHIRTDHPDIQIIETNPDGIGHTMLLADNKIGISHNTSNDNCIGTDNNKVVEKNTDFDNHIGSYANKNINNKPRFIRQTAKNIVIKKEIFETGTPKTLGETEKSIPSLESMYVQPNYVEDHQKSEVCNCDPHPDPSNDAANATYKRRYRIQSPPSRSMYRTSIEKWRPANGTIYCPKCGANRRPLIRTQTERSSNNSCCAVCILGCWPFCFLPFLLPTDNKEYLHCSNCKTFLGLYDRSKNCVRPNREYCQTEDVLEHEKKIPMQDADKCKYV